MIDHLIAKSRRKPRYTILMLAALAGCLVSLGYFVFAPPVPGKPVAFQLADQAEQILVMLFFAPAFETFLFQVGIMELAARWIKGIRRRTALLCCTSALFFAATHTFAWHYTPVAFIVGFLLALIYWIERERTGCWEALFSVTLVHGLINLFNLGLGAW